MKKQRGLSGIAVLLCVALAGAALLLVFKIVPVYTEFANIKNTLQTLSAETNAGEYTLRHEFDQKAAVADITAIKGDNLTVVAGNSGNFLRAQYQREVPLFANVSLLFHFDTQAGQPPAVQ
ncbi:DUF4845 domain-containing protein [Chromobacterium amazonense]|uniref:DUF4845 domain-containing protein n=1 Tax=Chromobacterium amazonense TaxID=1382803 RepID=A0A2S9X509_9NEIS|nr:DUF4845 domain-containing protein [Chromobacterium amazonense]KIA80458.1 hypothetical protein QR66_10440 [Chromobacterium piscinae]MBM2883650.1 DUF4845 domain-containing protein [Chromobacterium amazonense]MDE1712130.1 DUF4845 domain-containing protein [Chromobacterium amazonense]MDQ4542086.1 DUF4845 domain-containing protein [Chromobacterium amazonense]PRP70810.1 DUF4845 domain-containing protein [Chromobacterium amazonense]